MPVVLSEPFNNFTAAPWTLAGTPTIVAGRTGTAANITGTTTRARYNIPAGLQTDTVTIGFAFQTPVLQTGGNSLVSFLSDSGATSHTTLDVASTGQLRYVRLGSVIASSAVGIVTVNTWHYGEIATRLSDASGTVTVRLNGATVINTANLDTRNGGTKDVYDAVQLGIVNGISGGTVLYDDLYLRNDAFGFAGDPINGPVPPGGDVRLAQVTSRALTVGAPAANLARVAVRALTALTGGAEAQAARFSLRALIALPPSAGTTMNVWTGTEFVDGPVKVWDGLAFVDAVSVKVWDGDAFVETS